MITLEMFDTYKTHTVITVRLELSKSTAKPNNILCLHMTNTESERGGAVFSATYAALCASGGDKGKIYTLLLLLAYNL